MPTKKATTKKQTAQAVLVTTEHRGVFFGYLKGKPSKAQVTLERCRNCIYWESSLHGFVGLASDGPTPLCKVGPAAAEVTLFGITSVCAVSSDAAERWEAAPWRG